PDERLRSFSMPWGGLSGADSHAGQRVTPGPTGCFNRESRSSRTPQHAIWRTTPSRHPCAGACACAVVPCGRNGFAHEARYTDPITITNAITITNLITITNPITITQR